MINWSFQIAGEDIYAAIVNASLGDDEDVYVSIGKNLNYFSDLVLQT